MSETPWMGKAERNVKTAITSPLKEANSCVVSCESRGASPIDTTTTHTVARATKAMPAQPAERSPRGATELMSLERAGARETNQGIWLRVRRSCSRRALCHLGA